MSSRTTLPLLIVGALLLAPLYIATDRLLLDSFRMLEMEHAEHELSRVRAFLAHVGKQVGLTTSDWGSWDDTYAFMGDRNADYLESNMVLETFTDNDIDMVVLLDTEGRMIWGRVLGPDGQGIAPPDGRMMSHVGPGSSLGSKLTGSGEEVQGLVATPLGLMILAASDILRSDNSGTSRGSIYMGRLIDAELIDDIQQVTGVSVELQPATVGPLPTDSASADRLLVHRTLHDPVSRPVAHMSAELPRDLYQRGVDTIGFMAAVVLLESLVFGAVAYVLARRLAERRAQVRQLAQAREAAAVFDNTHEAVMVTSAEGAIIAVNPAFCHLTGYAEDQVMGRDPAFLDAGGRGSHGFKEIWNTLKTDRHWRGELWSRHKDGLVYPVLARIDAVCDDQDEVVRYVAVFSDSVEMKREQPDFNHKAYHDALTGLPNRLLFEDRLRQAMEHARRSNTLTALFFLDLDRFKEANDVLGHISGDELLQEIGRRLRAAIRSQDTVARLSGDEFTVIAGELKSPADVNVVARKLSAAFDEPVPVDNHEWECSASIGVALFPLDTQNASTLIEYADAAMDQAKQRDGAQWVLHNPRHLDDA